MLNAHLQLLINELCKHPLHIMLSCDVILSVIKYQPNVTHS